MARVAVLCASIALLAACGGGQRASDPAVLVPWHTVGTIELGEPKANVERDYGAAGHGYHVQVSAQGIVQGYYDLHSTELYVEFWDGKVNEIGFATPYYRTADGFGVGSRIPFGPCHQTKTSPCEHRWHGFIWNEWRKETPCGCWFKMGRGPISLRETAANFLQPAVAIFIRRGRVDGIYLFRKFVD